MQRKYVLLLKQLEQRIKTMRGNERPVLEAEYDILKELPEDEVEHVLAFYAELLKINGMSEILAFQTTIEIAKKAAKL